MDLSAEILGTKTATDLKARAGTPVLVIGGSKYTRGQLASVSCFNYVAAANLTAALTALDAKNTRDVFHNIGPRMLALPKIGAVSLAVLGAAFEAEGLGGDAPLKAWSDRHRDAAQHKQYLTFLTLKAQSADVKADKKERRASKARKLARSTRAHALRVDRHLARSGNE